MTPPADRERPDYGIDAPSVIRNLLIAAFLCLSFWGITTYGAVSRRFTVPQLMLGLAGMAFGTGVCGSVVALWMLWDSKVGKLRRREQLLNYIQWTSNERVLDVGCGRGLLLIGAAKRLT